jgi:hypothetical protein
MSEPEQPTRPPFRELNRYAALKPEPTNKITREPYRQELFTLTIIAATNKGETMDQQPLHEEQFLIDLIFKPKEPGLKLRVEETQLLLAYIGEILREIEEEERLIQADKQSSLGDES